MCFVGQNPNWILSAIAFQLPPSFQPYEVLQERNPVEPSLSLRPMEVHFPSTTEPSVLASAAVPTRNSPIANRKNLRILHINPGNLYGVWKPFWLRWLAVEISARRWSRNSRFASPAAWKRSFDKPALPFICSEQRGSAGPGLFSEPELPFAA